MSTFSRRATIVALLAAAVTLAAPPSAAAQQPVSGGPHWNAWLGCWSASPSDNMSSVAPTAHIVCVVPTADANVVDVTAIADGTVLSRDRIDASGRPHIIDSNNCTGSESARWSADGRRVFLQSAVTCDGVPNRMSAVLAITGDGEWIDARSTSAGTSPMVRVAHYHDIGLPATVPAELAQAMSERRVATMVARGAAGAPVGTGAIIEASHLLDAATLEAWTRENGQRYAIDARTLTELADAGVPPSVTDAMISVTNRTVFSNDRQDVAMSRYAQRDCGLYGCYARGTDYYGDQGTTQRLYITVYNGYDPWGFGYWPFGRRFDRGIVGYAPYGYAPYGYGRYGDERGWGYGYGDNYGGRTVTGYTRPPTIVLHANPGVAEPRGRSEKGKGYTSGASGSPMPPPTGRTATPRPNPPAQASPAAPARQPERAQSRPSGNEGNQSHGGGRTAKGRP